MSYTHGFNLASYGQPSYKLAKLNHGKEVSAFKTDPVLIRSGALSASATMLVAFWRELRPGEERQGLIVKCVRALNPQFRGPLMRAHACVNACIDNVGQVADMNPAPAAPSEPAAEASEPAAKKAKTAASTKR